MPQNDVTPTRKVGASALAGALSVVLVWVLNSLVLPEKSQITAEVASAITTIISFIAGYFIPEAVDPQVAWAKMLPLLQDKSQFEWRKVSTLAKKAGVSNRTAASMLHA